MKTLVPALLAGLLGAVTLSGTADAGWRRYSDDWDDGYRRTVVVERHVIRRPVVRRVIVERPVVYRKVVYRTYRPVVRRVVVERPLYRRASFDYGWRREPWRDRPWRDRSQCWLPERHLCR